MGSNLEKCFESMLLLRRVDLLAPFWTKLTSSLQKKRNFGPLSRRLKMSFAFLWQLGPKVSIVGEMGAKYSFTIFSLPFLHIYCSSDQKKTFLAGSSVSVRWLLIRLFPTIFIEEINRFYVCWQLSHKINYLALKNDARFLLFCNWRFH